MAVKQGEKLIAVNVPEAIDVELSHAAIRLRKWIVRPRRALDKGPMMAYLAAWFIDQPIEEQVAIISAGQSKIDGAGTSVTSVDGSEDVTGMKVNPVLHVDTPDNPLPKGNRKRTNRRD